MSEVAPQIPEELFFECAEGYINARNSGLEVAMTPELVVIRMNNRFMHRGELKGDLGAVAGFMRKAEGVAPYLGFNFEYESEHVELHAPNVGGLNTKKKTLTDAAGVNDGTFIAFRDGDSVSGTDYLAHIAKGEIPISQSPEGAAHDIAGHALGFAVMSQQVFDTFRKAARKALDGGDRLSISNTIDFIDFTSNVLANSGGVFGSAGRDDYMGTYSELPHKSSVLNGMRFSRDSRAQNRTMARVKQFVASSQR